VSPILLRPVREQLEHDRVIRLLYARARRRFQAGMNPGGELNAPVGTGDDAIYPDLVLASTERGHRLQVVVEVETGESVNNLEALAEWARMARLRAAFHLYVPAGAVEAARRLCNEHGIVIQEIWSYHPIGDQMRFTLAYRAPAAKRASAKAAADKAARRPAQHKAKAKIRTKTKPAPRKRGATPKRLRPARKPSGRKAGRARARK
jgi:hypothetical protein